MHGACKPDHELSMKNRRVPSRLARVWCGLVVATVAACSQDPAPDKTPAPVKTQTVAFTDYSPHVELTGEIRAQVQSDLSFRVSGRVIERTVDVGAHVTPEQPLAQLDPQEQEANV